MPNAAPGAATILDYSEMRRPSINNSCNKVIVIKLDKLYYSKPKLYYDKPKLFNNNMPVACPESPDTRLATSKYSTGHVKPPIIINHMAIEVSLLGSRGRGVELGERVHVEPWVRGLPGGGAGRCNH